MAYPQTNLLTKYQPIDSAGVFGTALTHGVLQPSENVSEAAVTRTYVHRKSAMAKSNHVAPTPYTHFTEDMRGDVHRFGSLDYYGEKPLFGVRNMSGPGFPPAVNFLQDRVWIGATSSSALPYPKWSDKATADNIALSRLQDKRFNMGTALVELMSTANHLARRSESLLKVLVGIKKRKPKLIRDGLGLSKDKYKDAADLWLEYKYGVLPLCNDVKDLTDLIANGVLAPLLVSAKGKSSVVKKDEFDWSSSGYDAHWDYRLKCDTTTKITAQVTDPNLSFLERIGLANLPAAAWEAVPYSFVVDWVLPVGGYLELLSATKGLSFLHGYTSYRQDVRGKGTGRKYGQYLRNREIEPGKWRYCYDYAASYKGRYRARGYHRVPFYSFPTPSLSLRDGILSWDKIVTSLALIKQLR